MKARTHDLGRALVNGPNVWVRAITIGPFIVIWDSKRGAWIK